MWTIEPRRRSPEYLEKLMSEDDWATVWQTLKAFHGAAYMTMVDVCAAHEKKSGQNLLGVMERLGLVRILDVSKKMGVKLYVLTPIGRAFRRELLTKGGVS